MKLQDIAKNSPIYYMIALIMAGFSSAVSAIGVIIYYSNLELVSKGSYISKEDIGNLYIPKEKYDKLIGYNIGLEKQLHEYGNYSQDLNQKIVAATIKTESCREMARQIIFLQKKQDDIEGSIQGIIDPNIWMDSRRRGQPDDNEQARINERKRQSEQLNMNLLELRKQYANCTQ